MVDLLQQKTRKNSVNLAGLAASNSRSNLLSSNSLNASVGKNARRASISSISGGGTSGGSAFMLAVAAATASNAAAAAAASNLSRMSSYDSRASSQNSFNFGDLNSLSLNETNEIATKLKTNLLQLEESRLALMSQIEQVEKHALFLQKLTDSMHNKRDSLQIPNATPSKLAISKNTKSGNNGSDSNEGSSRDLLVAEPEEYKEKDQSTRSSRVESRGKMSSSEVLSFNPSLMAIQSTSAMQLPNNNVNDKGEMDVNDGSSSALPVVNKTSGFALVLPDYKVDTTAPTTGPTHLRESAVEIVISENLNGHNSK